MQKKESVDHNIYSCISGLRHWSLYAFLHKYHSVFITTLSQGVLKSGRNDSSILLFLQEFCLTQVFIDLIDFPGGSVIKNLPAK